MPPRSVARSLAHPRLQLVRYAAAGAAVFGVYVGGTFLLSGPVGAPIQVAIAIAYVVAIAFHFVLQRVFVFADHDEFAQPLGAQIRAYLLLGAVQYVVTAASTTVLPGLLDVPDRAVYLVTAVVVSGASFLVLRLHVFSAA
jgi:putative flippase GtrA